MKECGEFGAMVDVNRANVDLTTVTGVYVEGNIAKDAKRHEDVEF